MLINDSVPCDYIVYDEGDFFTHSYQKLRLKFPRIEDAYGDAAWQSARDPFRGAVQPCKAFKESGREFYIRLTMPFSGRYPTPSFRILCEVERPIVGKLGRVIMWKITEGEHLAIL